MFWSNGAVVIASLIGISSMAASIEASIEAGTNNNSRDVLPVYCKSLWIKSVR